MDIEFVNDVLFFLRAFSKQGYLYLFGTELKSIDKVKFVNILAKYGEKYRYDPQTAAYFLKSVMALGASQDILTADQNVAFQKVADFVTSQTTIWGYVLEYFYQLGKKPDKDKIEIFNDIVSWWNWIIDSIAEFDQNSAKFLGTLATAIQVYPSLHEIHRSVSDLVQLYLNQYNVVDNIPQGINTVSAIGVVMVIIDSPSALKIVNCQSMNACGLKAIPVELVNPSILKAIPIIHESPSAIHITPVIHESGSAIDIAVVSHANASTISNPLVKLPMTSGSLKSVDIISDTRTYNKKRIKHDLQSKKVDAGGHVIVGK